MAKDRDILTQVVLDVFGKTPEAPLIDGRTVAEIWGEGLRARLGLPTRDEAVRDYSLHSIRALAKQDLAMDAMYSKPC